MLASNTREGEVYRRLLEKLEEARAALGGKVCDVPGELFEGQGSVIFMVDAIRYGAPRKRSSVCSRGGSAVDVGAIERLVAERICGPPGSVSRSGPTPFNQHAAIDLAKLNAYQGRLGGLLVRLSQARIASATSAPFETLRG